MPPRQPSTTTRTKKPKKPKKPKKSKKAKKTIKTYWTDYSTDLSRKLLLPAKNAVNPRLNRIQFFEEDSWFTVKQFDIRNTSHNNQQNARPALSHPLWQKIQAADKLREAVLVKQTNVKIQQANAKKLKNIQYKRKRKIKKLYRKLKKQNKRSIWVKVNPKEAKKKPFEKLSTTANADAVRPVELKFTLQQKNIINNWIKAARWTYNQCVDYFRQNQNITIDLQSLRNHCVTLKTSKLLKEAENSWVSETPFNVRDGAAIDFLDAYNFQKTFIEEKNKLLPPDIPKKIIKMKFRSREDLSHSIVIHSKNWSGPGRFYPTKLLFDDSDCIQAKQILPKKLRNDTRLVKKENKFYLHLTRSMTKNRIQPETNSKHKTISFDPGQKCFLAGYDVDGKLIRIGDEESGRLFKLQRYADCLQGKIFRKSLKVEIKKSSKSSSNKKVMKFKRYKYNNKKRKKWRKTWNLLRSKVKNRVKDLHYKVCNWLCKNYKVIILGKLDAGPMCQGYTLRKYIKRKLLSWSHGAFRDKLTRKASQFEDCLVKIVDESMTTQTCINACGKLNIPQKNRQYVCSSCNFTADRDDSGCCGIFIKTLTDLKEFLPSVSNL